MKCKKKVTFCEPETSDNVHNEKREFSQTCCNKADGVVEVGEVGEESSSNTLTEEDLAFLLKNFNPLDFGIKEKLTESEKKILIREIYGKRRETTSPTGNDKKEGEKKKNFKKDIIIKEVVCPENDKECGNVNLKNGKKKKKKKKKEREEGDNLEYLDGDCYFPNDGYNYEQHLKPISTNFVEIKVNTKTKRENDIFDVKPTDEEEKELFKTFEEDAYDELNDNFIFEAQNVEAVEQLEVDTKLIWGNPDPLFFIGCKDDVSTEGLLPQMGNAEDVSSGEEEDRKCGSSPHNGEHIMFDGKQFPSNIIPETEKQRDEEKNENKATYLKLSDFVKHELKKEDGKNTEEIKKIMKKKKEKNGKIPLDNLFGHMNKECKQKIMQIVNIQKEENASNDRESSSTSESQEHTDSYDCETILTTKTNTTNHPCKLAIPKKICATTIPSSAFCGIGGKLGKREGQAQRGKSSSEIKSTSELKSTKGTSTDGLNLERYQVFENVKTIREKNETAEEKRERKKSVKEAQRLNRKLKKENSQLMKNEKKLMTKKNNPFDIRDNVKYVKLSSSDSVRCISVISSVQRPKGTCNERKRMSREI
ncbi:hypothetical protein, conserved [Plasmodium ovale curtisi]|nr:hypothetical protein, conserved [Plasmodium ovale curtisi]